MNLHLKMKSRFLPILLTYLALCGGLADSRAAEAPSTERPEWANLFGDVSPAVAWQSAQAAAELIASALAAGRTEGVTDWAETIHLASHALADRMKVTDTERKRRLDGALLQAARLADQVLEAARRSETEKLSEAFRRLRSALALAQGRLPTEITSAPTAPPRFAKPSGVAKP